MLGPQERDCAKPSDDVRRRHSKRWLNIMTVAIASVLALAMAEGLLRITPGLTAVGASRTEEKLAIQPTEPQLTGDAVRYSAEELRTDLPRFTERQGGRCIEIRGGMNWDPRFGFASKKLDKECARRLFSGHAHSIVLMGGSAMQNSEAPNYLTSIDTYAFEAAPSYASLNLAESGARHSNMLARLLHEVIELNPTHVVFLDGFNEFNSVRYGGEPEDDFYWTAGVSGRIHQPLRMFRDKIYESSRLLELIGLQLGDINPARMMRSDIDPRMIERAADYYVKMRAYTAAICRAYGITCVFIIQPVSLLERQPSSGTRSINVAAMRQSARIREYYAAGYEVILKATRDQVLDASQLFDGVEDVYLDTVHFNKRGSKLVGGYIRAAVDQTVASHR